MSSGRILLSQRGREDVILSQNPQMSYFIKRYASKEQYEYLTVDNALDTLNKKPNYGDNIRFQVPRRGDLLSRVFVKIVFPPSYLYSNLIRHKTDNFALYSIIEHVELVIGGQLIERLTGEYILNYLKLYSDPNVLNTIEETTEMNIRNLKKSYADFGQFVLLPIPFYFSTNLGQELPLIAITRQNIVINIKLASKPPVTGLPDLTDVSVTAEYVLLENETTKNVFVKHGLQYRVSQLQMNSDVISTSETVKKIELDFQNPVREIFIFVQARTYQELLNANYYNFFGNYRNSSINFRSTSKGYYLSEHQLSGASLSFNGTKYIDETCSGSASMMCNQLPQKLYANADNIQLFRGYVIPFVINPLSNNPCGHINMSRILKKDLTLHLNESVFTRSVRVYARSYNIMIIKDGICGLMFTNPSYYNPKITLGDGAEIVEGSVPSNLPVLTDEQGYYYAVKVDDGHDIVGAQLFTSEEPVFASNRDLHDNEFSYIFNTTDTFVSNISMTDSNVYAPSSISQFLRYVVEIPNETDSNVIDKYHITSSNNYIFTSNYGFAKYLRIAIKTNVSEPLSSLSLDTNTAKDLYGNLNTTANVVLYRSNTFFDQQNIDAWVSNAISDTRVIRVDNFYESPGQYYSALVTKDSVGTVTSYDKVNFCRTYDFSYSVAVIAPLEDSFDSNLNESFVTFSVVNLSGSGTIQTYLGSSTRGSLVQYFEGDTTKTITFQEELVRGAKSYSVRIFRDGESDVSRFFTIIAGGNSPPLYHAFEILPPDGGTIDFTIDAFQAYSPAPDISDFVNSMHIEHPSDVLTTTNIAHSGGISITSNNISNVTSETYLTRFNPTGSYIYTTEPVSITFYTLGLGTRFSSRTGRTIQNSYIETTIDENSIVKLYSSELPFDLNDIPSWINGADKNEFKLSEVSKGSRVFYKGIATTTPWPTNPIFTVKSVNNYYVTSYYIPFDIIPPVMTVTFEGNIIVDGGSIQIERFTPLDNFVNINNSDYTYINIQVDDSSATVEEVENTISNTVPGFYTISFTATDPFLNSSTQTFTVVVADQNPPEVVSNTFIGAGTGHTLNIVLNEPAVGEIFQNGVSVHSIFVGTTTPSYTATGLPLGVEHVYTGLFEDAFGNQGLVDLGTYIPDLTPPVLTVTYDGVQKFHNNNIYLERYSTLGTFSSSATDLVDDDTTLIVVESGDTVDLLAPRGTTFLRSFSVTDSGGNSNVANIYIDVIDTITPEIIVYHGATRIYHNSVIEMERLTPIDQFINNTNNLYAVTNEQFANVTESNTFQNSLVQPYTVTFVADDGLNSNSATITVNVVDTTPISLTNQSFLGTKANVFFSADMSELGNVNVKRDGVTVNTWTQVTSFSEQFIDLPEGPPQNVWSVETIDNFSQTHVYVMGTHTSDKSPPELILLDYDGVTRLVNGSTLYHERTTDFTEITFSANDSVSGNRNVVVSGYTPTNLTANNASGIRTYTSTDAQGNSNVIDLTVVTRDTIEPFLVSSSVTASGSTNEITINAEVSEPSYITLEENGVIVETFTGYNTQINTTRQGLTEGATYTYELNASDPYGNSNVNIPIGSATVGDFTPPVFNMIDYGGNSLNPNSTVTIERYSTFTELETQNRASDNVDGLVDVSSQSSFPDTTERYGTSTPRVFTTSDNAGNSNTITINFVIGDTVSPSFSSFTPVYDNITGGFSVTGFMSEECTVNVYSTNHSGTLLDTTNTSGISNSYSLSTSTTSRYYALKAQDGINTTNYLPLLQRPVSAVTSLTNIFDGTNNHSNIRASYTNILHLGASSVRIDISTDPNFSIIPDTQIVSNGVTSVDSGLISVGGAWSLRTYYVRVSASGFVSSTEQITIYAGVKPNPPTAKYTLYATADDIDIHHIDGPFANPSKPSSATWTRDFNNFFDDPYQYGSHYVTIDGTNVPMIDFYWGSNTYSTPITMWTSPSRQPSVRISSLTARLGTDAVVTYTANTTTEAQVTVGDRTRWVTDYEVTSIDYANASGT